MRTHFSADSACAGEMCRTCRQTITVPFDFPVCFTHDLFDPANPLLISTLNRLDENRKHRVAVWVDSGVVAADPGLPARISAYFEAHSFAVEAAAPPFVVTGGEAAKDGWTTVQEVIGQIAALRLDRQSYVIAIGGGAVLDMAGFAAAIVHRGLRLIRVPTTTLAQNDAGIGVKNGINAQGQKNFLGTFAPPFAVLNDYNFLKTLDFPCWIGGIAEAFKVAIIKDAAFFEYLQTNAPALKSRDLPVMEYAVLRCAELHLEHIRDGGDPFEFGSARPLDFGHWAAHKLEIMSGCRIGHGFAVAAGIALDAGYAALQGMIRRDELDRIIDGLTGCGLPVWYDLMEQRKTDGTLEILGGLEDFREHLGGNLTITLPQGIGQKQEVHHMDMAVLEKSLEHLRDRFGK